MTAASARRAFCAQKFCFHKGAAGGGKGDDGGGGVPLRGGKRIKIYDHTGGGAGPSAAAKPCPRGDFVEELIDLAAERDIGVCLDTSGFCDGERLLHFARKKNVTHILYDMKSIDDQVHQAYTGQSNKIILENLRLLASDEVTRSKVQMRMPLVNEVNDSWDIIRETAAFYKANGITRVTLLPYHNLGVSKKRNIGGKPVDSHLLQRSV